MVSGVVKHVECKPYDDQVMGTSGLRKKVAVVQQPHYIQAFVSAIFDTLKDITTAALIVGGDGRYYNKEAIAVVLGEAAARHVPKVIMPCGGMASTPAVSLMIRNRNYVRKEKIFAGFFSLQVIILLVLKLILDLR